MKRIILLLISVTFYANLTANKPFFISPDSVKVLAGKRADLFYDSLDTRAHRHRFTGWLHDRLVNCHAPNFVADRELVSYEYYQQFNGKTIASINIHPLAVFGPTFEDTTRVTRIGIEKLANSVHTKSNINVIRKNVWIKSGDAFDASLMMDNERYLRTLPYLKDIRVLINTVPEHDDQVNILILTKDVFAFGVTGKIDELTSGALALYNQNVFGIGHQITFRTIGHTTKEPHMGFETFYSIDNFAGNFVNFQMGYFDTYRRHGFQLQFDRQFIRPQSDWGGGFNWYRSFRSDRLTKSDPVQTSFPLDFNYLDGWLGRSFLLGKTGGASRSQLTFSGRLLDLHFHSRPDPDDSNNQYFANRRFYLGSISFSQRRYIRDYLIYSYGITEDIPRGFLNEFVFGYDDNEFIKRWYTHFFFSSGNLIPYKPFYLFASTGIGGYFNKNRFEQGQVVFNFDMISRLFSTCGHKARQFLKIDYMLGIRRFQIEDLMLRYDIGIRGFHSREALGKQRLNTNIETVIFGNREILKFNTAFFTFVDLGIIGSNQKIIFTQDYYTGVGFGVRLRNENLVFKTIQIRLAFYPNHPPDMHGMGFIAEEQRKSSFYSFQPRAPEPLVFE